MCKGFLKSPFSSYSRAAPDNPGRPGAVKDHDGGLFSLRKLFAKSETKSSEFFIGGSGIDSD
jgi:hypothetical protein